MAFSLSELIPKRFRSNVPFVPVLRLNGGIGAVSPLRPGLSLAALAAPLERAFSYKAAPAVAIVINSPGGAAVQSHLIFQRIRALADEKRKRVIVAVEDVAASGGYMIAIAGDEIIVDPSSIVGSIGVVSAGFGFTQLIEKIGVERRIYTSGINKAMLDPFLPENPDHVARLRAIQEDIHGTFISLVKSRRGGKLNGAEEDLFTGEYWAALKGRELGLVDRIGDMRSTLRERYGDKVETPLVAAKTNWLGRASPGLAARVGDLLDRPGLTDELISSLEARAIWARYGL